MKCFLPLLKILRKKCPNTYTYRHLIPISYVFLIPVKQIIVNHYVFGKYFIVQHLPFFFFFVCDFLVWTWLPCNLVTKLGCCRTHGNPPAEMKVLHCLYLSKWFKFNTSSTCSGV